MCVKAEYLQWSAHHQRRKAYQPACRSELVDHCFQIQQSHLVCGHQFLGL